MPTNRPNPFHDLHHQTEREIARTRQASLDLEKYLRSAQLDARAPRMNGSWKPESADG